MDTCSGTHPATTRRFTGRWNEKKQRGSRNSECGVRTAKHLSRAKAYLLSCYDRQGAKDAKGSKSRKERRTGSWMFWRLD